MGSRHGGNDVEAGQRIGCSDGRASHASQIRILLGDVPRLPDIHRDKNPGLSAVATDLRGFFFSSQVKNELLSAFLFSRFRRVRFLFLGRHEPDRPLGRIGRRHELADGLEDLLQLRPRVEY